MLTNLVKDILGDKDYVAVALNASRKKDSDHQLREALAQLRVLGLDITSVDPHAAESLKPKAAGRRKGMKVQINGGSYISDKTKQQWTDALNNGHKIKGGGRCRGGQRSGSD